MQLDDCIQRLSGSVNHSVTCITTGIVTCIVKGSIAGSVTDMSNSLTGSFTGNARGQLHRQCQGAASQAMPGCPARSGTHLMLLEGLAETKKP